MTVIMTCFQSFLCLFYGVHYGFLVSRKQPAGFTSSRTLALPKTIPKNRQTESVNLLHVGKITIWMI